MTLGKIHHFFLVLCFMGAAVAYGAAAKESDVDLLLKTLHYKESLKSLPDFLVRQFMQAIQPITSPLELVRVRERAEDIAHKIFDQNLLLQETRQRLMSSLSEKELADIRDSAQMPLIEKITRLEAQELEPDFHEKLSAYLAYLNTNPIPAKRGTLLRDLSRRLGGTEMTRVAFIAVAKASAMVAVRLKDEAANEKEVDEALAKETTTLLPQLEEQFIATKAYVYKSLTDEELERYLQMMSRDEWQKATDIINDIFKARFEVWSQAMVQAFAS